MEVNYQEDWLVKRQPNIAMRCVSTSITVETISINLVVSWAIKTKKVGKIGIKIKDDYWNKTDNWQETANKNLWIATISLTILILNYTINGNYIMATIFLILFLTTILPQIISYRKYKKKKTREEYGLK